MATLEDVPEAVGHEMAELRAGQDELRAELRTGQGGLRGEVAELRTALDNVHRELRHHVDHAFAAANEATRRHIDQVSAEIRADLTVLTGITARLDAAQSQRREINRALLMEIQACGAGLSGSGTG